METAETVLLAAERLVAERGFGVSLREIGTAAGQRNHSAVQYHFGTRDRLVEALYEHRMVPLNRRRLALIGDLRAAGLEGDTSALVDAYIRPLAEHVLTRRGESWYMRFIARHALSGAPPKWPFPEEYASGVATLTDMLIAALPGLPGVRLNSMNLHLTMVLASLEQQLDDPAFTTAQARKVIDDLFRTTVAILTTPCLA